MPSRREQVAQIIRAALAGELAAAAREPKFAALAIRLAPHRHVLARVLDRAADAAAAQLEE